MKKRICVFTGTRAEYGLFRSLMEAVQADERAELVTVVSGTHLSPEFGLTEQEIVRDGFAIDYKLPILGNGDGPGSVTNAMGALFNGAGEIFSKARPDIVVVLGDRYESFGFTAASLIHHVPVAHIHGGELTYGAIDDAFRHSISKMAWWHFTATEEYRQRVIQLGEAPERVFNVGAMANDSVARFNPLAKEKLEISLGMKLSGNVVLGTFHPETQNPGKAASQVEVVLQSLLQAKPDAVVWTMANADAEGKAINEKVREFIKAHPKLNMKLFDSLGQSRYMSVMKLAKVVLGNSSSGMIEAPILGVSTVNVGVRQLGRLKTGSIIDCDYDADQIVSAIRKALGSSTRLHPFGKAGVGQQIVKILLESEYPKSLAKSFKTYSNGK